MGSDDEDSDSDSSDIGKQFANAQKFTSALKRPRQQAAKSDSGDDDDDGSDDDDEEENNGYGGSIRRRRGKATVDERLAGMDHQKILDENRKKEAEQRALTYDSDDDDDDDDDEEDDDNKNKAAVPVDLPRAAEEEEEEDAFSSDEEQDQQRPTTTNHTQQPQLLESLRNNQDIDPQMLQQLLEAHNAANLLRQSQQQSYMLAMQHQHQQQQYVQLQQQQQQQQHYFQMQQQQQYLAAMMHAQNNGGGYPGAHNNGVGGGYSNYSAAHLQQAYALAPSNSFGNSSVRILDVIVQVEIEAVDGSEPTKRQTVQLNMRSDEDFNVLNTRLMEKLQIKGQNNRATFKHNQQILSLARTPDGCELQGSRITLTAKIIVAGSSGGTKSAATAAPGGAQWGNPIRLKLRSASSGKVLILNHKQKQPFSFLAEEFRKQIPNCPAVSALNFQFDGERLNMNQTPMNYDMEDEDLIDVKGV